MKECRPWLHVNFFGSGRYKNDGNENLGWKNIINYQYEPYYSNITITNIPCNTDQTILFSYGFPMFDFRWFSVVYFELLKFNWNNIRKNLYTTVKNLYISNWKPSFLKRWKYVFNSCCVTRDYTFYLFYLSLLWLYLPCRPTFWLA